MENFKCPGCKTRFDDGAHSPLILSKCAHHFCKECVRKDPNSTKNGSFLCPLDGIVSEVLAGNPDSKTASQGDRGERVSGLPAKGCVEHNRKFEFFCLNDEIEICSLCGLFGAHKGHQIIVHKELEEVTKKLVQEIESERKKVLFQEMRQGEPFQKLFERRVAESLRSCRKQVDALYQKIKTSLKKQFATHFEKIETEINDYLKVDRIQIAEYDSFVTSFTLADAELTEQKRRLETALDGPCEAYLKFKRIKDSLKEIEPVAGQVETVLKTIQKIKLPMKFEVTPHNLSIHLLDSSFLPTLKETLKTLGNTPNDSRVDSIVNSSLSLKKMPGDGLQPIRKLASQSNVQDPSVNLLSEKFNHHHSSRSRTRAQNAVHPELFGVAPDTGSLVTAVLQERRTTAESGNYKTLGSTRSQVRCDHHSRPRQQEPAANEVEGESDVNLYNFRNIYETKGRPAQAPGTRMSSLLRAVNPDGMVSPNRKNNMSQSQLKDTPNGNSNGVTSSSRNKALDRTLVRRSSFNELKLGSKYQKNVITIEDDLGTVTNQFVDEAKLKNIISSFKTVSKNVKRIELSGNTFVCNPVLVFKATVTERTPFSIILNLHANKVLCSLNHNRRDLEQLKSLNIEIIQ